MAVRSTIVIHGFKQTFEMNKETGICDRAVDWITYSPIHAVHTTTVTERVEWLRPPKSLRNDDDGRKMEFLRLRWEMIERAYNAWKQGIEMPVDGTPLTVWPALNAAFVQVFHDHGIKTVERVADIPDSLCSKIPLPNVQELRRQAQLFLENSEKSAQANRFAEIERQNRELQEQLKAAMDLLTEEAAAEKKPRRGRRRPDEPPENMEEAA